MSNINVVSLAGVLSRDLDSNKNFRYTPDGKAIAEITVAGTTSVLKQDGVLADIPFYVPVTVFGAAAERLVDKAKAGFELQVFGVLQFNEWTTPEGVKKNRLIVKAVRVEIGAMSLQVVTDEKGGMRSLGGLNHVVLSAGLTKTVDLRSTATGSPVVDLQLGFSESWQNAQKKWVEKNHYASAILWREQAEAAAPYQKGDYVIIVGGFVTQSWFDKETGEKRYRNSINATSATFMTRVRKDSDTVVTTSPALETNDIASSDDIPEDDLPF